MKLLLESKNRLYIPSVDLIVEVDGVEKELNNRDVDASVQIQARVTLATAGQKQKYLSSKNIMKIEKGKKKKDKESQEIETSTKWDYDGAVIKHVEEITGLEELGIKTGKDLVEKQTLNPVLPHLVQDLTFYICDVSDDPQFVEGLSTGE